MAINVIDTKVELKDWIKRKLGWPTINLEFHDAQLEDNIDDAIKKYTKHSGDATYRSALMLNMSAGVDEYPLDDEVEAVLSLETESAIGGGINTLFTIENQLYQAGYIDIFSGSMNLTSYQIAMEYLDMSRSMLAAQYFTEFNKYTNTLTITPKPDDDYVGILEIYSKRDFTGATSTVYDIEWVKDYSLALSMIVLGRIWGKYDGMPLPGGGTLNSSDMKADGREDKRELDERLMAEEGEPLEPSFG